MCGICGVFTFRDRVDEASIARMQGTLKHRGPDGEGVYVDEHVGLGHVRLNVMGFDPSSNQPMCNEDGSVWIAYNGQIYNHAPLREQLLAKGHRFRSDSDTEVVIHAYEEWDVDCLRRFNGMFAFAIWDRTRQSLVLARDRAGQKPLFYYAGGQGILFASELRALVQAPEVPRIIRHEALNLYFAFLYIPAPHTIFQDVWKLPAGSYAVMTRDSLVCRRYWRLGESAPDQSAHVERDTLAGLLEQAVTRQLTTAAPVGVFLSGGLDSSTVLAMAARTKVTLDTFTAGMGETRDELPYARAVADVFHTRHHEVPVAAPLPQEIESIVGRYGEPLADSGAIPLFLLSRAAKQHISVALGGDGGDEVFGGYRRYQRVHAASDATKAQTFEDACQMTANQRDQLFRAPVDHDIVRDVFRPYLEDHEGCLASLMRFDFEVRLPELFLTKTDVAAMASGLEVRSPLLDDDLVTYLASLPLAAKLGAGGSFELKKLLKEELRRQALLPASIIDRRKQGFAAPLHAWLRRELRPFADSILLGRKSLCWQFLEPSYVEARLERFYQEVDDDAYFFWKIVVLELWLKGLVA
jgi:asparagine synthase (glutamine-hydrolysing)